MNGGRGVADDRGEARESNGIEGTPRPVANAVLVDHREARSGVLAALQTMPGIAVRVERLKLGDYLVNTSCLFERKTLLDFAESIKDGRLFTQARRLASGLDRAAFIIEGTVQDLSRTSMRREALQGAVITLTLIYELPVLRSHDPEESWSMAHWCRHGRRRAPARTQTQNETASPVAAAPGPARDRAIARRGFARAVRAGRSRDERQCRVSAEGGRHRFEDRGVDPVGAGNEMLACGSLDGQRPAAEGRRRGTSAHYGVGASCSRWQVAVPMLGTAKPTRPCCPTQIEKDKVRWSKLQPARHECRCGAAPKPRGTDLSREKDGQISAPE